jgi:predicted metal-dependent phosphoesterase TrpH
VLHLIEGRRVLTLIDGFDGTRMDVHVHTNPASSDSMLQPEDLVETALATGLTAVGMTEHDFTLESHNQAAFRAKYPDLFINFGMEVSTDLGHMLAFGLPGYLPGIRRLEKLREAADEHGAFVVVAHPFRRLFDPVTAMRTGEKFELTPQEAAEQMEVFKYVHAIEVANGANTPQENYFALEVADILGMSTTGGSDAHSTSGIGTYATAFEKQIDSPEALLEELHAGSFHAVHKTKDGRWVRFVEGSIEAAGINR